MAYTTTIHKGYDENNRSINETVRAGEGATLFVGGKTYQVMSDIWEHGYYAIVWDETAQKVTTVDWIIDGKADATPEVIEKAKAWMKAQEYARRYKSLYDNAWVEANRLNRGDQARIVKGRKYPHGIKGKVVGFTENQWGKKVGLALTDEMVEVKKGDRVFQNHKDVIWVARHNVEKANVPEIDKKALEVKAEQMAAHYVQNAALFSYYNCH